MESNEDLAPSQHVITLDFREYFEIEPSDNCQNDFLEIRDGPHGYNNQLAKLCGNTFPSRPITSSDRHLWIHFQSDENIEYRGFKAVFQFISRRDATTPERIPCYINLTDPYDGVFGKKDIPLEVNESAIAYPKLHVDCLWSITVPEGMTIYLQFMEFVLHKPNDCVNNFVQVFPNNTDIDPDVKTFCGSMANTVTSKSNQMFVRLYYLPAENKTTFQANYTAFRTIGQEAGKTCEPSEFSCEDTTCIHGTLWCDGNFNCRSRYDEEGCKLLTWATHYFRRSSASLLADTDGDIGVIKRHGGWTNIGRLKDYDDQVGKKIGRSTNHGSSGGSSLHAVGIL
ncbi:hypothetical protein NQ317_008282 [Molorchus minor]|uniref:CUB domain-containing protein n=1 Tax=Molorchus minor TaxID=1323400 RepID=A0ABQ9JEE9_9CUCU|nr:hypothetical protein NQ317_008282 [Molorchus minor]